MFKGNINRTFQYLDDHFQINQNGVNAIDEDYLKNLIELTIDNTERLYFAVTKDRRHSIEGIVFSGMIEMCNMELNFSGYQANGQHIKKWFEKYDKDYKTVLAPLVKKYKEERESAIAERQMEQKSEKKTRNQAPGR